MVVKKTSIGWERALLWHQQSCFYTPISQPETRLSVHGETQVHILDLSTKRRELYWRLEAQRKGKATEQWPSSLVKELEWPTGQSTQKNRLMPRGEKDSGRGIKYVTRNPQVSGKVSKFPLIKQISAKLFISAFNFLNYSTTRVTTCSWY